MMESDSPGSAKVAHSLKNIVIRILDKSKNLKISRKKNILLELSKHTDLEKSKIEMIQGVVSLSSMNAKDIMIPRIDIVSVDANTKLKELIKTISDAGHSRIPVLENTIDNIIGILYVKDLLKYVVEKPRNFQLTKILHKPFFVPETIPLDDLLVQFRKRKLHLAIIVDEYGGVGGIVTLEDILEEIVGEIVDEFDEYKLPEIQKINSTLYEVDSRIAISELNNELSLSLPSDDFDTIGGLVFDLFGKIPKKNETVTFNNLKFRIKDIRGTRINRITLSLNIK